MAYHPTLLDSCLHGLVMSGVLSLEDKEKARAVLAEDLAPLGADVFRAARYGAEDIYSDAEECREMVDETVGGIQDANRQVWLDPALADATYRHIIGSAQSEDDAVREAFIELISRASPDSPGLLAVYAQRFPSQDELDDVIRRMDSLPDDRLRGVVAPADLSPYLDGCSRRYRELAIKLVGRLGPDLSDPSPPSRKT